MLLFGVEAAAVNWGADFRPSMMVNKFPTVKKVQINARAPISLPLPEGGAEVRRRGVLIFRPLIRVEIFSPKNEGPCGADTLRNWPPRSIRMRRAAIEARLFYAAGNSGHRSMVVSLDLKFEVGGGGSTRGEFGNDSADDRGASKQPLSTGVPTLGRR
jgi:hypothetical protein